MGGKSFIYVPHDERIPPIYGDTPCPADCGGTVVWTGTSEDYHFTCTDCEWTSKPLRTGGKRKPMVPTPLRDYRPDLVPESLRAKFTPGAKFIPAALYEPKDDVTPTFDEAISIPLKSGNQMVLAWAARGKVEGAKRAAVLAKELGIELPRVGVKKKTPKK